MTSPRLQVDFQAWRPRKTPKGWIRRHGLVAWLTWATLDQACGAPLTWSQRFWRWVLL